VIPVRVASDIVLVATAEAEPEHMADALNELLRRRVRFVRVEREQLERALETYYPIVRI
jgi:hypothetical protein